MMGMVEFGHVYMSKNTLRAATKRAARYGAANGITTAMTEQELRRILQTGFDDSSVTILIKDASVFDTPGIDPETIDYDTLPAIELSDAETKATLCC